MSLFFEDEIKKVMKMADQPSLENIMDQDPRRKQSWTSKNRNASRNQKRPGKNQRDLDERSDYWGM